MYLKGEPSESRGDYIKCFWVKVPWLGDQEVKALCRRWMEKHHPEVDFRLYVGESSFFGFFKNGTLRVEFGIDAWNESVKLEKAVLELREKIGDILLGLCMRKEINW